MAQTVKSIIESAKKQFYFSNGDKSIWSNGKNFLGGKFKARSLQNHTPKNSNQAYARRIQEASDNSDFILRKKSNSDDSKPLGFFKSLGVDYVEC